MTTILRLIMIATVGWFGPLILASPQAGPGAIRGQVTDPAGASVPGAEISVNNGHGTARSATTDIHGEYILANLPAGAYTMRASAKGFALIERTDIAVDSGTTQTLNFPLSLASEKQSVTVSDPGQSVHVDVDPSSNADALVMRGSD